MPFGKPKKGAGSAAQRDDGMIQPVLDLLQKNRVHDLPPDDSPATRERFKATYEEAYSMLQTMRYYSGDSNAGACRLQAALLFHTRQPAAEPVSRVLDLEGTDSIRWLLEGPQSSSGIANIFPGPALAQLRHNIEVDEHGLPIFLRALEIIDSCHPGLKASGKLLSFDCLLSDEIAAVKEYVANLEKVGDGLGVDRAHWDPDAVSPLPFKREDLFETWAPQEAIDRWGFIVAAFCTPDYKETAERLRRSLQKFGLPYTFQAVEQMHPGKSPKGTGGPEYSQPNFILEMLETHQVPVVYMDCDLIVMSEPVHIQEALKEGADFAIVNFLAAEVVTYASYVQRQGEDDNERKRIMSVHANTAVRALSRDQLHSNAAINLWNNTEVARRLLQRWRQSVTYFSGIVCTRAKGGVYTIVDDQVFDWLWNNRSQVFGSEFQGAKPFWLPLSYARLPTFLFDAPIVNHPAYCCEGPNMCVAAHSGTRKVHLDFSSPLKTRAAATALGMSEKYSYVDVQNQTWGVWSPGPDGKFQACEDIKGSIWPPGMLEWGDYTNPYI